MMTFPKKKDICIKICWELAQGPLRAMVARPRLLACECAPANGTRGGDDTTHGPVVARPFPCAADGWRRPRRAFSMLPRPGWRSSPTSPCPTLSRQRPSIDVQGMTCASIYGYVILGLFDVYTYPDANFNICYTN